MHDTGPSTPPRLHRRHWLLAGVAVLLVAFAAGIVIGGNSGRGGSRNATPSLAGDTPGQILRASLAAARAARSFQMSVSGANSGIVPDLTIRTGPGGTTITGTYTGISLQLALVGRTLYLKGSASFWSALLDVDADPSPLLAPWMSVPPTTDAVAPVVKYAHAEDDISSLVALTGLITTVRPLRTHTSTVVVRGTLPKTPFNTDAGAGDSATLTISTEPPFYPIRLSFNDAAFGSVTVTFADWDGRWAGPDVASAVPLSAVQPLLTPSWTASTAPVPAGRVPSGLVSVVTATPTERGVSVDLPEAESVARRLWTDVVAARHYRDPHALGMVESGPALAVDRELCTDGCPPPPIYTMSGLVVVMPHETSWPADFLAQAAYRGDCPQLPCLNSFVAVQDHAGAPWTVALVAGASGPPLIASPVQSVLGYSPNQDLQFSPDRYVEQFAAYLNAVAGTGKPPASTWVQSGPIADQPVNPDYVPPAVQHKDDYAETVELSPDPSPVYAYFAASGDFVCGTLDWYETDTAVVGHDFDQPPDRGVFGPALAPGRYHEVVRRGIRMNCYSIGENDPTREHLTGDWEGTTSARGS